MSKVYTEQDIATLISEFNEKATEKPAPTRSTRRTAIVTDAPEAPARGYRVVVGNRFTVDVDAPTRGDAVLMALAVLKMSNDPNARNASAYVFLWNYTVTDSEGTTVAGIDMREEVQRARMAMRRP